VRRDNRWLTADSATAKSSLSPACISIVRWRRGVSRLTCGRNSVGRMPASQAGRRRFEPGRPLSKSIVIVEFTRNRLPASAAGFSVFKRSADRSPCDRPGGDRRHASMSIFGIELLLQRVVDLTAPGQLDAWDSPREIWRVRRWSVAMKLRALPRVWARKRFSGPLLRVQGRASAYSSISVDRGRMLRS
jgi:hypothetical protein